MQLFHVLLFEGDIEGTDAVYGDPQHNQTLATADQLRIMGVISQVSVSGGTPTLTVQLEHSPDNVHFIDKSATAEINAVTLSTTAVTVVSGYDDGAEPTGGSARLRLSLGGTTPRAHVRFWATGRIL